MAQSKEFLDEIDTQTETLKQAIAQVTASIDQTDKAIDGARERRKACARDIAYTILPNVDEATLAHIESAHPNLIDSDLIRTALATEAATYQAQIDRAKKNCNPDTYEGEHLRMKMALESVEADMALVKEPFADLQKIPNLLRLIEDGYGTALYAPRWFHLQYYRDWKVADAIIEQCGMTDWESLVQQYDSKKNDLEVLQTRVNAMRSELHALESAFVTYTELMDAMQHVPQKVLEQARMKLQAGLEYLDQENDVIKGMKFIDATIREWQTQNTEQQKTRVTLSEHLTSLQKIRAQVTRRRVSNVPDEYLQQLRSTRYSPAVPSYSPIENSQDRFFEGVFYGQMFDYFGQTQSTHVQRQVFTDVDDQEDSVSTREELFAAARSDTSGQS